MLLWLRKKSQLTEQWLLKILDTHHPAWSLLFSLLILTLVFRIRLFAALLGHEDITGPFSFEKKSWSTLFAIGDCISDSALIAGLGLSMAIFARLLSLFSARKALRSRMAVLSLLGFLLSTLVGFHYAVAYRLIWALEARLGMNSLDWARNGFSLRDMVSYAQPMDFAIAFLGPFVFSLALLLERFFARIRNLSVVIILLLPPLALALGLFSEDTRKAEKYSELLAKDPDRFNWLDEDFLSLKAHLPSELATNPFAFTLWDLARLLFKKPNHYQALQSLPSPRQLESVAWIDPEFVLSPEPNPSPSPPSIAQPPPSGQKWNLLIFVIESAGALHALEEGRDVMPFTSRLADKGLHALNHYSTGVSTIPGCFSIFTGIYPPRDLALLMHPKIKIPSLYSYLGTDYDHFLITGNSLQAWFPKSLLVNTGLKDILEFSNMEAPAISSMSLQYTRDERAVQEIVEKRLLSAREPFNGLYYIYAPHYPYHDYGPSFRIRPDIESSLHRYINDLNLSDHLIEKTLSALSKDGKLDRTIVVILGDHGEGFGKLIRDRLHGMQTTDEVQRTPLVIWQPKLIAPTRITVPTSHVDLLPTLLELMGISGNPMQGESLLSPARRQKFVFVQNMLRELSSISRERKKMVIRFDRNQCVLFDLKLDAAEAAPMDCDESSEQFSATLKFFPFQAYLIPKLNLNK